MRLSGDQIILSPSDLMRFQGCQHATALDLRRLRGEPLVPAEETADLALLQAKGDEHEKAFLNQLTAAGHEVAIINKENRPMADLVAETTNHLKAGPPYIFQAALSDGRWAGFADFLERVDCPSSLGAFSYEIIDTKLKTSPDPKHLLQLSVYGDLLANQQGSPPDHVHVVLGDQRRASFRTVDYAAYTRRLKHRLEAFLDDPTPTRPEPVAACSYCSWREVCKSGWEAENNLFLVAGITRNQVRKLESAGVGSIPALASRGNPVPKLAPQTLDKLRIQARLQNERRRGGPPTFQLRPIDLGRGLALLPKPDPADLFFDMEGDPYYPEGLEYLFGVYSQAPQINGYRAYWAHDRDAERQETAAILAFFIDHIDRHPSAHIYHYAQYEVTALKRLANRHGVGEAALDRLLRENRFVDLYRVVRQGIFASEPSYSIKDIEAFYRPKRAESVTTAMDSVVGYERWRENEDATILEEIRAYNETDCRSTQELRDWLVQSVRPRDLAWHTPIADQERADSIIEKAEEAEASREHLRAAMAGAIGRLGEELATLLFEIAWYHEREDKPQWWNMFDKAGRDSEELIDDLESLAGLMAIEPARRAARSKVRTYRFPEQETKLRAGSRARLRSTLASVGIESLDPGERQVIVKFGPKAGEPPDEIDLVPDGPIDNEVIRDAVQRVVTDIFVGNGHFQAIEDLLHRRLPRLPGHAVGRKIVRDEDAIVEGTVRTVLQLDRSCLAIQGPPGTGKTYVSARSILALLKAGKRVAVSSNSHKAIDNLLLEVAREARRERMPLNAVKKGGRGNDDRALTDAGIHVVETNDDDRLFNAPLVGGTAWLFSRGDHHQAFDYLFVDEAGQVSLANVMAMASSARNIVLVGDPMQLSQPTQGVHPGQSGAAALEYLLAEHATVPADRGIFLPITRRMHPEICRYISETVYEGRLHSDAEAARQNLRSRSHSPIADGTGIRFIDVAHEGNSQSSPEEAKALVELWHSLIGATFRDRDGRERPLTPDDILVVSPYNAQVNLLTEKLPAAARVGTVDRFQGQEAPVCLISMATSSGDEIPRNIEFLFSVNRLNVAISRAKVLAVLFASPRLLDVPCSTVDQMRLVNALCAARDYASKAPLLNR